MNRLKYTRITAAVLVLMSSGHAVHGQSTRVPTNSVQNSRSRARMRKDPLRRAAQRRTN